jgi:uncharacterized membrane-anchored protein
MGAFRALLKSRTYPMLPHPSRLSAAARLSLAGLVSGFLLGVMPAGAQGGDDQVHPLLSAGVDWVKGPAVAPIGSLAEIRVPEGFMFTGAKGTQTILEMNGNPVSGDELGFIAPTSMVWSAVFEWSDVGYVKDDEKDVLDAEDLLQSIRAGNAAGNQERRRRGWPELQIVGWEVPPQYNGQTHNLEWAIKGESEGQYFINYNVRLLGRKGVMSATLLVNPEDMSASLPGYRALLADYAFLGGQRYAEYRQGDKVAQYGLAALIAGGAAVGAAKLGLFAWLAVFFKKGWKLIVVAVAAVAALLRRLVHGGRREEAQ